MTRAEYVEPGEPAANCRTNCPLNTALLLGQAAEQLARPREWLMAAPGETAYGPFSANAVRAVVEYYHVEGGPAAGNYAWHKEPPKDVREVHALQCRLMRQDNLTARDIATLQRAVLLRSRRRDTFTALPEERRSKLFADARPLMEDDLIIGMTAQYPETAGDTRLANLLAAREAQGSITPTDREIGQEVAASVYTFDQAPFLVAGYALEQCSGPWRSFTEPVFRRPMPTSVCPHGSPRDSMYLKAAAANGGVPHPG